MQGIDVFVFVDRLRRKHLPLFSARSRHVLCWELPATLFSAENLTLWSRPYDPGPCGLDFDRYPSLSNEGRQ
jgi:hypothetical protein